MNEVTTEQVTNIESLKRLKGTKYTSIVGTNLDASGFTDEVIILTDTSAARVTGDVIEKDFEGFSEEYSVIKIEEPAASAIAKALESGNIFRQFSDALIVGVKIVFEQVTLVQSGTPAWSYESVKSIVIELESGFIAITKVSHHVELLHVDFLATFSLEQLPETVGLFEDDLERSYIFGVKVAEIC